MSSSNVQTDVGPRMRHRVCTTRRREFTLLEIDARLHALESDLRSTVAYAARHRRGYTHD